MNLSSVQLQVEDWLMGGCHVHLLKLVGSYIVSMCDIVFSKTWLDFDENLKEVDFMGCDLKGLKRHLSFTSTYADMQISGTFSRGIVKHLVKTLICLCDETCEKIKATLMCKYKIWCCSKQNFCVVFIVFFKQTDIGLQLLLLQPHLMKDNVFPHWGELVAC